MKLLNGGIMNTRSNRKSLKIPLLISSVLAFTGIGQAYALSGMAVLGGGSGLSLGTWLSVSAVLALLGFKLKSRSNS